MEKVQKIVKRVFGALIARPFKNYNVQDRAFKAISVSKRDMAPRHLTTQEKIFKYIEEHPELKEIVANKPETLLNWLKKIRVVSRETPNPPLINTGKKLPVKRDLYEVPSMFGDVEPKEIPKGKVTFQRTTKLISDYASAQVKPDPEAIAEEYGLEVEDAKNLVRHFKAFKLHIPATASDDTSELPPWFQDISTTPLDEFVRISRKKDKKIMESSSKKVAVIKEEENKNIKSPGS